MPGRVARIAQLLATVALMTAAPVFAAPRDTVEQVATIIENNYFDPAKAHEIASALRREARAGKFDQAVDARNLATTLTERLRPLDHHFNVTWSAAEPSSASGQSPVPQMSGETLDQRSAYGLRSVQMLPGAIGYLDMRTFSDFRFGVADEPARRTIDAALELVSRADAVIIDLRKNGGGSPAMVGYLVSAFTPPNADIYNVFHERDRSESERPQESYSRPNTEIPLYVLVSGRTASAAEATAYTLQAARRATIVGAVTAGAANPGGEFPVGDGFNVFVSTGTPINAVTGSNWEGTGVQPDVRVDAERALERASVLALETILARSPNGPGSVDTRWTLEALRAEHSRPSGAPLRDYTGSYAEAAASLSVRHAELTLRRAGRPPLPLMRLQGDTFFVRDEPSTRVIFERDAAGKVQGFQLLRSSGQAAWFPK